MRRIYAIAVACVLDATAALAENPVPPPVATVLDGRLPIGDAQLPIFTSQDWSQPLPAIRRVVIVVHGYERNAADYARNITGLGPSADTMLVLPQFLADEDIAAHQLPNAILRWQRDRWSDGYPAESPAPLSAFDTLDALLAKTADRAILPNLTNVVLAGFSAGSQLVQRYAAVGKGETVISRPGVARRFVVGSPSSFVYFGEERPQPTAGCAGFNDWKYGFAGDLPPYVAAAVKPGLPVVETHYAVRDIVYLVGADDNDPNHRFLDKSCAAEAQGPTRLARTQAFFATEKQRAPAILNQRMWVIDGAAHNAAKVFGSPCGRAALFGVGACQAN